MNEAKELKGKFIATKRKELGYTQKKLAEKLNVTDKAISKWETGAGMPDISMLKPLSEILGVSVIEILEGREILDENLSVEADNKIVNEIKINKRNKQKYRIILVIVVIIAILAVNLIATRRSSGVIEEKITLYNKDASDILKNVSECMKQTHGCSYCNLTDFLILCDVNKSIEMINVSGYCSKNIEHWSQSLSENNVLKYCNVYTDTKSKSDIENLASIRLDLLGELMEKIDLHKMDPEAGKKSDYMIQIKGYYCETDDLYYYGNGKFIKLKEYENLKSSQEYICIGVSRMEDGESKKGISIFVCSK